MKHEKVFIVLVIIFYFWFFTGGCTSSYKINKSELYSLEKDKPLTVLTSDTTLYRLDYFTIYDSLLLGKGTSEKNGNVSSFNGKIEMRNILYIQSEKTDLFKTFLIAGVTGFFAYNAVAYLSGRNNLTTHENIKYEPMPMGSCPYVYTYDGKSYNLESETFAGAIFKKAERINYDDLYFLKAVGNKYYLRINNERPETDYINELKLLVIDAPQDVNIVLDSYGNVHTISRPVSPVKCFDFDGKNALAKILSKDKIYWESDIASKDFSRDESLRDGLILEFNRPDNAKFCKLVVNGVNTSLGVFAFRQIFQMKGRGVLRWYNSLDNGSKESAEFIKWMMKMGMLHVKLWENGAWVEQGALWDTGPVIAKDQAALLDLRNVHGKIIKVMLESSTDLWKLDQIYVDYSPDKQVGRIELSPGQAVDQSGADIKNLLKSDDDLYYVNVKGQYSYLTFIKPPAHPGEKRFFVLKSKGYYHQWFTPGDTDRTALLNKIIKEPGAAGKLLYPVWKQVKYNY